jgi:hypothetical protein
MVYVERINHTELWIRKIRDVRAGGREGVRERQGVMKKAKRESREPESNQ